MKTLIFIIISAGLFCSASRAQTVSIDPNDLYLNSLKPRKPVSARPAEDTPWILSYLNFVDLYHDPSLDRQWEEIKFGYNFTSITSLVLDWGYNGLLQPKNATDAEIWDPELLLNFQIPLSAKKKKTQWYLLTGTSLVLPASPDSIKNGLLAGFSANLGFQVTRGPWTFISSNTAYVYAYKSQPVTLPDNQDDDTDASPTDDVAAEGSSLTYVTTQQWLRLVYDFDSKTSGKIETWYNMYFAGGPQPTETVQILSSLGHYFTPHFRVFTGFTTSTEVDNSTKPPLFHADSTALRVGFFLKL